MTHLHPITVVSNRSGIALPLALLGLFLVSVIIIGTLVTSSSERALSFAHQDATQSLFASAGALEAYVGEGPNPLGLAPAILTYTPPGAGAPINLEVERLAQVPSSVPGVPRTYFSVRAQPVGGGRAVSAMISMGPFEIGIESAATFGGDSRIGGSSIVSDGRDSQSCSLPVAGSAVEHGSGTTVDTVGNNVSIIGEVKESHLTGEQLVRKALGGMSIPELARYIHDQGLPSTQYVTFGTNSIWGTSPRFEDRPKSWFSISEVKVPQLGSHSYNWYCPGKMDSANPSCTTITGIDTLTYKMVLVDAGGGEITIQGDHGQGLLLVMNGGLRISGGFVFRGLIASTHDIDMTGTGNKVEGAIVSENKIRVDRPADSDSDVLGNAVVRFNRCALDAVTSTVGAGGPLVATRTFAWTELVR